LIKATAGQGFSQNSDKSNLMGFKTITQSIKMFLTISIKLNYSITSTPEVSNIKYAFTNSAE